MRDGKPRIILFDIETNPNILTAHSLFPDNRMLPFQGIIQERFMICASWKELGSREVHSTSILEPRPAKKGTDWTICKKLHEVLSEADAVIAHNGDKFDIPWVNTRLVYHGMKPLPPFIQIDTRKIAKQKFRFNSNRLDYLGQFLGVGRKIKTDYELWLKCLQGDAAAIRKMVEYNKQDVRLLERVYLKLRPFVEARLNRVLWGEPCPSCGEGTLQARGFAVTRASRWHRFQCTSCGAWSRKPIRSQVVR